MAPCFSQLLVLFALLAVSSQRNSINRETEIRNVVKHLKTHATHSGESPKGKNDPTNGLSLLNIDTLNLYVKPDRKDAPLLRTDDDDRMCKITGRCGCGNGRCERSGNNEETEEKTEVQQILDELEKELDKKPLRCPGGYRCGSGCCGGKYRSDDAEGDEDALRCKYGRCGRGCCGRHTRSDSKEEKESVRCSKYGKCTAIQHKKENDLISKLEQAGKTYRINDDLDAIVIDLSKVDGLDKLTKKLVKNTQSQSLNDDRDVDMDYVFDETRNGNRNNGDLEGIVVDLTQASGEKDLVSRVVNEILGKAKNVDADPVRPHELVEFYLDQKRRLVGNALNFVKNSRGKKDVTNLSADQKYQLQKLRSQVQRLGAKTDNKEVEKAVSEIVLGDGMKSKVLPHNEDNNNVYVPSWVHKAVKASRDDLRSKRLFPLTNKQRLKMFSKGMWRRHANEKVQEYGVPFQLQIQGLGQVNP